MNLTMNLTGKAIRCIYPCIDENYSRLLCLSQSKAFHYEFVWLFVIAFIFGQIPYLLIGKFIKIEPEIKTKIMRGFKFASYLLNLAGILWFLLVI